MRPMLALLIACVALAAPAARAAAEVAGEGVVVDLSGEVDGGGLILGECDNPVRRVQLTFKVDKNGTGSGLLVLDPNPVTVDEFGLPDRAAAAAPAVSLECALRFLKKKTVAMRPAGGPEEVVEYRLYEVTGPKIASRLTLSTEAGRWSHGRFIAADKDGKVRNAVTLRAPEPPQTLPCHPGCFPEGTPIRVPDGIKAVDALRAGDAVTTVRPDGAAGETKVASVFVTRSRLVEVRTETALLLTTRSQPLSLAAGGLRPAGELKAGDRIHTWDGRERKAVAVQSVADTGRDADVFNLVLAGDPVLFVADGFLARSKPPAPAADVVRP